MAVAGDILVKLAADFAEYAKGMDEAVKKLDAFGTKAEANSKKIEAHQAKVEAFGKSIIAQVDKLVGAGGQIEAIAAKLGKVADTAGMVARVAGVAGAFALAAKAAYDYGESIQKAAAEIAKLAGAHNLTSDQVQAIQDQAKRTGKTFDDLADSYKRNEVWLASLTEQYKSTGQAIDTNTVAKLAELDRKSAESAEKMEQAFNRIRAAVAPLYAEGKALVLDAVASAAARMVQAINALNLTNAEMLLRLALAGPAAMSMAVSGAIRGQIGAEQGEQLKQINDEIERLEKNLKAAETRDPNGQRARTIRENIANLRMMIPAAADQQREARQRGGLTGGQGWGGPSPEGMPGVVQELPPAVVTGSRGGGGGGRTDEDRLEAQIAHYRRLGQAARDAQEEIRAGKDKTLESLQREIALNRRVDEVMSGLVKRYGAAAEQARPVVEETERQRAAVDKLMESNRRAEEIEERLGDGTRRHAKTMEQLAEAYDTGRLSVEAFNRASRDAQRQRDRDRRALAREQGGLDSFVAGIEEAGEAWTRANDAFSLGQNVWNAGMQAMGESIDVFTGKSKKDFGEIALGFAEMLAKMAMQAAASQVFKLLFGAIGGGLTGYASAGEAETINMVGGGTTGSWLAGMFGTRAAGGDVQPGRAYDVGEFGPERFIPSTPGTIVPNDKLGMQVNVFNNAPGVAVQAQQQPDGSLAVTIERVRQAIARDFTRGGNMVSTAVERAYGVQRGAR